MILSPYPHASSSPVAPSQHSAAQHPSSLPHTRQQHEWDCGLACAAAVIEAHLGGDVRGRQLQLLQAAQPIAPSIWTIDVVGYLEAAGIRPVYFTTEPNGVNSTHARLDFYTNFERDEVRIKRLFAETRASGLSIIERSLSWEYFRAKLLGVPATLFIVLLDMRWVACLDCRGASLMPHFTYAGHYVVLTGVREDGAVEYMDPSVAADRCYMPPAVFDRARRSTGTDEDVLEISARVAANLADDAGALAAQAQ